MISDQKLSEVICTKALEASKLVQSSSENDNDNSEMSPGPRFAAFLIGIGWGMFYIGGPMALSERITDADRGFWFTRFSAFQMAGICGSPILLIAALAHLELSIQTLFLFVSMCCVVASLLLGAFGLREPRAQRDVLVRPWVKKIGKIGKIAKSDAIRPIVMVGLGGAVFSGMMSFQSSLVEGTPANASTFFAVHAATVVVSRLLLARYLSSVRRTPLVITLVSFLIVGILFLLGIPLHPIFQIVAAVLTGLGYGLVYPVIQTWAINDSALDDRHAALTWFVVAYFVGIFGFPALGGWILVAGGKMLFILTLALIASFELVVAMVKNRV